MKHFLLTHPDSPFLVYTAVKPAVHFPYQDQSLLLSDTLRRVGSQSTDTIANSFLQILINLRCALKVLNWRRMGIKLCVITALFCEMWCGRSIPACGWVELLHCKLLLSSLCIYEFEEGFSMHEIENRFT